MLSYGRDRDWDLGILLLRVGFGFSMLIFHGYGKLIGGPKDGLKSGGHCRPSALIFIRFSGALWRLLPSLSARFS